MPACLNSEKLPCVLPSARHHFLASQRYGAACPWRYNQGMHVTRFSLAYFRNYKSLDLALPQGLVLLQGDNAQGKTNLLEAVCVLALSRSPRAGREGELLSWDSRSDQTVATRIFGEVKRAADPVTIEVTLMAKAGASPLASVDQSDDEEDGLLATAPGVQKRLRVNGVPRRAIDLLGQLRVVLFRPEDMALVTGTPSDRRRTLDILLSQMKHRYPRSLQRYSRTVQQRNHLLRRIAEGQATVDELAPWDAALAAEGSYLLLQRQRAVERLSALAGESHGLLSGDREQLMVSYEPTVRTQEDAALQTAEALAQAIMNRLIEVRRRDIALGQTTVGPHRDDLVFSLDRALLNTYGSRGQQRTATLAWKLAEARYAREVTGEDPVVLLDDIFSEMDATRRSALLEAVQSYQQVLLTTTDIDTGELKEAPAATFTVRAGRIEAS